MAGIDNKFKILIFISCLYPKCLHFHKYSFGPLEKVSDSSDANSVLLLVDPQSVMPYIIPVLTFRIIE